MNNIITAEILIQRVLNIISKNLDVIEKQKEELSDNQLRLLPQYLRAILATRVEDKKSEKEEADQFHLMSTAELQKMYDEDQEKKKK